jgi:DtxR family Mn-dependent transcriptional regulator
MMQDFWKAFDETELSHSSVHHLLAIDSLKKQQGYARLVDVSNHLKISRASVSITIGKLRDKGFVNEDRNRFLKLSGKGAEVVNSVLAKRYITKEFFHIVLKLSEKISEINACKIEHLLDEETGARLQSFIDYYRSDSDDARAFRTNLSRYIENSPQA